MPTAIGLRVHSGWAALVALGGRSSSPGVVDRRRLEMADDAEARQPYHTAEGRPLKEAAALLDRYAKRARTRAAEGLSAALDELQGKGCEPRVAVILAASGRPLPGLEAVLASHALIHTADGEHFRDALAAAAETRGLRVQRIRERELMGAAQAALGRPGAELQAALLAWGKPLGPPWTADQKLGALAAWIALAGRDSRPRRR